MVMVPEYLLKCLDQRGFINEVKNRVGPSVRLFQAYEDVEYEMEKYFGKRKYKDFGSFQVVLFRDRKRRKECEQKN